LFGLKHFQEFCTNFPFGFEIILLAIRNPNDCRSSFSYVLLRPKVPNFFGFQACGATSLCRGGGEGTIWRRRKAKNEAYGVMALIVDERVDLPYALI
jgi:hypothetical protein